MAVNGLLPDEATDRLGNCGLDAFAVSLLAQMKDGRVGAGQTESAKHKRNLNTTLDKVALLRRVDVAWWAANASEAICQGMAVARLCSTVSGWPFEEYKDKPGRTGNGSTWHACMH